MIMRFRVLFVMKSQIEKLAHYLFIVWFYIRISVGYVNTGKQAGAELGQAQLMLKLDLTLIFFRFGLIELTGWYSCS